MTGRALLAAVRFYQRAVSPVLPPRCRFHPTCSAYAVEAIELHGAGRGAWLAARRLARCAPWHPGGVDLVPEPRASVGTARPSRSSDTRAGAPAAAPSSGPQARPARATRPEPQPPASPQEADVA